MAPKNRNPICVNISRRTNLIHFQQSRSAVTFILIRKNTMIWQLSEKVEITHRIYPSGNEYIQYIQCGRIDVLYAILFIYVIQCFIIYFRRRNRNQKIFFSFLQKNMILILWTDFPKTKKKERLLLFKKWYLLMLWYHDILYVIIIIIINNSVIKILFILFSF